MLRVLAVGAAGAAGALLRYWISTRVGMRAFPWATLGINVAGSLVLGYILGRVGGMAPSVATTAVTVGFLGAFTTFSTFTYETVTLVREDRPAAALAYVAVSVMVGLAASALGYVFAQRA